MAIPDTPDWVRSAIFWHVYPLGFTGAPVRPTGDDERVLTHRLRHLVNWLDHIIELGCNGLLLGPIFTSTTHGYDTEDWLSIDPRLGDDADFDQLIAEAHARGIRVVLDGVFNHVSVQHWALRAALADPEAPENGLFRIDRSSGEPYPWLFEGNRDLIALDHTSPRVVDDIAGVLRHWQARGVDGWRFDAAYAVQPDFWARVLPGVRSEFPESWFFGEMIHGDYGAYAEAAGLDSITQYELWKGIWSSLADVNAWELDHALTRHNALLERMLPTTFIGNHDVTRITEMVGDDLAVLAATVLFTVGGVPCVYYGDERGWHGRKEARPGGDDAVRPIYPDSPADLNPAGDRMQRVYQQLIGVRRRHPWLVDATTETLDKTNESLTYQAVGRAGQRLTVSLDIASARSVVRDGRSTLFDSSAVG